MANRLTVRFRPALAVLMGGIGILGDSAFGGVPLPTAKEALQAIGRRVGPDYAEAAVQVIGVRGTDQPVVWRVLARDPYRQGVVRDFTVQNGQIVNDQFVPPAYLGRIPQIPIVPAALQIDSSRAFVIADRAANAAKIGFDSLDYEARASDPATGPVWIVRLNDARGLVVGEILIRARDGSVLRQQWFPQGVPPDYAAFTRRNTAGAEAVTSPGEIVSETVAEGWEKTVEGVSKGSTAVRTGVVKAGGAVREFFEDVLEEVVPPAQQHADPSPDSYY